MSAPENAVDILAALRTAGVAHMCGLRLRDIEAMLPTGRAKALADLDRYYMLGHHHCRIADIGEPKNWLDRELVKQSREAICEPIGYIGRFDLRDEQRMDCIDAALARCGGAK